MNDLITRSGWLLAFLTFSLSALTQSQSPNIVQLENEINELKATNQKGWKWMARHLDFESSRLSGAGQVSDLSKFYDLRSEVARAKTQAAARGANWSPVGPSSRPPGRFNSPYASHNLGRINTIAFHPTDSNTFYTGISQGGIWKTTDHGQSWTALGDDLPILRINDISINPKNPDQIFACLGDYAYIGVALNTDDRKRNTHYGVGVYKSENAGLTWEPTGLTYNLPELDNSLIRRVFIDTANAGTLLAGGVSGMWRSTDTGTSWTKVLDSLIWDMEQSPADPSIIYATSGYVQNINQGYGAILRSIDFGQTWAVMNSGIPPRDVQRIELTIAHSNPNVLYAITCDMSRGFHSFYKSDDAGLTWDLRAHKDSVDQPNILAWSDGMGETGGQGTYDLTLLVHPENEDIVYTGGVNVWGTEDGGETWKGASYWYHRDGFSTHADQHFFAYNQLDEKIYLCNDGGLYRTDSIGLTDWSAIPGWVANYRWPTDWENITNGMQITAFYRLSIAEDHPGNVLAGAQDNGTYYLNNGSWRNIFGGDGMDNILHPSDTDVTYVSSQYGNLAFSDAVGFTQYGIDNDMSFEQGGWTTPMAMDLKDPNTIYAGYGNLWKSVDAGNSFFSVSNFSDIAGQGYPNLISAFAVAENDPARIYVAKRVYFGYNEPSSVWSFINSIWTDVTAGLPDSLYPTSVVIHETNEDTVLVTYGGFVDGVKIFASYDAGNSWQNISQNLPNIPVNVLKRQRYSGMNTMYAGTDLGVYFSNDTTNGWELYSDGLPNVIVSDLEIHYSEEKVYISTFGRGIWKADLTDTSAIPPPDTSLPTSLSGLFMLEEVKMFASPVPTDGPVHVSIESLQSGNYQLELLDVTGRLIETRNFELPSKGNRAFDYHLDAGQYFLRLRLGRSSKTLKLLAF